METGINMKNILLFILCWIAINEAFATCSSPISRTNSSANSVLTSTKYNTDLNTVYTKVNDLDGDCLTDESVSFDKIDETTAPPLSDAIKEGCLATRSDANTISVDKCYITVNGVQIEKTTATTVTWGCTGCSSETNSTVFYVYATSATPLTLKISTTAPDAYGYNSTDRIIARFYNDSSGNILTNSVRNWVVNGFAAPIDGLASIPGLSRGRLMYARLAAPSAGACAVSLENFDWISGNATSAGTGQCSLTLNNGICSSTPFCWANHAVTLGNVNACSSNSTSATSAIVQGSSGAATANVICDIYCVCPEN